MSLRDTVSLDKGKIVEYLVCAALAALFICVLWVNSILNQRKKNIVINQSEDLTNFYISYEFWLELGAIDDGVFSRRFGLCGNLLGFYSNSNNKSELLNEMKKQFKDANLPFPFAFSKNGEDYHAECINSNCHKNRQRIKWVKDHTYDAFM